MPIKHGRAASVKSALTFSRRKTTSLLAIYVDEAGRRLYPRVCCFLLMSIPGAQQPCSGLTSRKGRGEWSKPCLTASGNRRLLCPLGASFCTSVGRHGESSVVVSSLHAAMSSVVTAAQHGFRHDCPGHQLLAQRPWPSWKPVLLISCSCLLKSAEVPQWSECLFLLCPS